MQAPKGVTTRRVHTFVRPPKVEVPRQPVGDIYYVKGCNGSGKSTVPSYLSEKDPDAYVCLLGSRVLLTVFPSFGILAFGKYDKTKSKGVDSLSDYAEIELALALSEREDLVKYDAFFEGIIPATILHTWIEKLNRPARRLVTLFLDTPLATCLSRVDTRNGGEDYNRDLVAEKFRRIESHRVRHKELFPTVPAGMIRSEGKTMEQMVELFLNRDFGDLE
ncbi:terminase small subunit [Serratia phage phiMAM1]|uniref:Putative kinase n=1 Tax=Serratia phage phiMAM1 TaxID=1262513 RepID=K7YIY0_9CAUD|nr:terminase small subunit [Serratia phage phiMAM1]AFX93616.1 putative kinase [Serratia phage phiMAM1]